MLCRLNAVFAERKRINSDSNLGRAVMEPSHAGGNPNGLAHETRIAKLEVTAVEHAQAIQLLTQHVDKGFEALKLEFRIILVEQLTASRKEMEAKIEKSQQALEARIAILDTRIWRLIGLLIVGGVGIISASAAIFSRVC